MSDIHALSGAYAIDALDDIERAQFERHLAECAECRAEVESLREAGGLLAEAVAAAPPPAPAGPGARRHRHRPPAAAGHRAGGAAAARRFRPAAAGGRRCCGDRPRRRRRRVAAVGRRLLAAARAQRRRPGARRPPDAEEYTQTLADGAEATLVRSPRAEPGRPGHRGHAAAARRQGLRALARPRGRRHGAGRADGGRARTQLLLEGDPATALGAGITVEPEPAARTSRPAAGRPVRVRERLMGPAPPASPSSAAASPG